MEDESVGISFTEHVDALSARGPIHGYQYGSKQT